MDLMKCVSRFVLLLGFTQHTCHGSDSCDVKGIAPRLCNGDFTTPGRCYELFEEVKTWHEADDACKALAPNGHLAIIESQAMQDFVTQEVTKKGWPRVWINGCLKAREWFWIRNGNYLAYQGCYKDEPGAPHFPSLQNLDPGSKPGDCIDACKDKNMRYASVQMDGNNYNMICRCSKNKEKRSNLVYDAECDTYCPGGEKANAVIDRFCAGNNRHLVFHTDGKRYHTWVPTVERYYAECVSMNHNHNHEWLERDCKDKLGYICDYAIWSYDECTKISNNHRWLPIGFCISIHNGQWDYYQALSGCFGQGGKPYRPRSGDEIGQLKPFLDKSTSYYFGLTHERWEFTTWRAIVNYFNWGTNQPEPGEGKDCFLIEQSDGYRWRNVKCNPNYPYVCSVDICDKKGPSAKPSTTAAPSTSTLTNLPPTTTLSIFTRDFFIGLGVGLGNLFVVIFVVVAIVCCYKKCRQTDGGTESKSNIHNHNARERNAPKNTYPDIESSSRQQGGSPGSERRYESLGPTYNHPYAGTYFEVIDPTTRQSNKQYKPTNIELSKLGIK